MQPTQICSEQNFFLQMRDALGLLGWRAGELEGEAPVRLAREIRDSYCPRTLRAASPPRLEREWCLGPPRSCSILQPHQSESCWNFPQSSLWPTFYLGGALAVPAPELLGGRLAGEGVGMVRPGKLGGSVGSAGAWVGSHEVDLVSSGEKSPMTMAQLGRWLGCPRVGLRWCQRGSRQGCLIPWWKNRRNKVIS